MTNTTKTMLSNEARNINEKLETVCTNYQKALDNGKAREAYNIMLKSIGLDEELKAIFDSLKNSDPIITAGNAIAYHSLKVLARGRKFIDKEGNVKFTPVNLQAKKLLEAGTNDNSRIKEDLIGEVILKIWEKLSEEKITINEESRIILTDETDDQTMKDILNVVQSEFYRHQQRHYKHEYRPIIDDEGNEDQMMVTAAMREWEKRIEYIGQDELFNQLKIELTEREEAILRSKLEQKQVERAYSDNGISKKRYVTRYKTLEEISEETGYSIKEVRTSLKWIKRACLDMAKHDEALKEEIKTRTGK